VRPCLALAAGLLAFYFPGRCVADPGVALHIVPWTAEDPCSAAEVEALTCDSIRTVGDSRTVVPLDNTRV
jgi:hypothetical protein